MAETPLLSIESERSRMAHLLFARYLVTHGKLNEGAGRDTATLAALTAPMVKAQPAPLADPLDEQHDFWSHER